MKNIKTSEFNMSTSCVGLRFRGGNVIVINRTAMENELADNRFQHLELDCLIYNDLLAYSDLILNGDVKAYLNVVTGHKSYGNWTNEQIGWWSAIPFAILILAYLSFSISKNENTVANPV